MKFFYFILALFTLLARSEPTAEDLATITEAATTRTISGTGLIGDYGTVVLAGETIVLPQNLDPPAPGPPGPPGPPSPPFVWPVSPNPGLLDPPPGLGFHYDYDYDYDYNWLDGDPSGGYGICGLLGDGITDVSVSTLERLASDLSVYHSSYVSVHPIPAILTTAPYHISSIFTPTPTLYVTAWAHIAPYAASSDISTLRNIVNSLSPPSSLSVEFFDFVSARNSWLAPQYIAQASIASQDLGYTGPEPTWLQAARTEVKVAPVATGTGLTPPPPTETGLAPSPTGTRVGPGGTVPGTVVNTGVPGAGTVVGAGGTVVGAGGTVVQGTGANPTVVPQVSGTNQRDLGVGVMISAMFVAGFAVAFAAL